MIVEDDHGILAIAREAKRVAAVGIKPESRADQPAHYVPKYLHDQGVEVVPVPVYYPEVTSILGLPVVRDLRAVGPVDIVDVFRRSEDVAGHLDDLLALAPKTVWMQLGIRNDEVAARLAEAGIQVVQDRCLLVEHRRAVG
ncbi:MAG: CoA-binding protein [Myxococcota bacterium]